MNEGNRMNHTFNLGPYSFCWGWYYGPIMPTENDILLGRGGNNYQHEGNKRLKELARASWETYENAEKLQKRSVAERLVQQIYALRPRGRFLEKDHNSEAWYEVNLDRAIDKAAQAYVDAVDAAKTQEILAQEGLDPSLLPVFRRKRIPTIDISNRSRNSSGSSSVECPHDSTFNRSRVNTGSSGADEDTAGRLNRPRTSTDTSLKSWYDEETAGIIAEQLDRGERISVPSESEPLDMDIDMHGPFSW